MAHKTIAQTVTEKMEAQGYTLAGQTSGKYSFRPGSNLSNALNRLGLDPDDVEVELGAKKQHRTEGTQLLIFRKP